MFLYCRNSWKNRTCSGCRVQSPRSPTSAWRTSVLPTARASGLWQCVATTWSRCGAVCSETGATAAWRSSKASARWHFCCCGWWDEEGALCSMPACCGTSGDLAWRFVKLKASSWSCGDCQVLRLLGDHASALKNRAAESLGAVAGTPGAPFWRFVVQGVQRHQRRFTLGVNVFIDVTEDVFAAAYTHYTGSVWSVCHVCRSVHGGAVLVSWQCDTFFYGRFRQRVSSQRACRRFWLTG